MRHNDLFAATAVERAGASSNDDFELDIRQEAAEQWGSASSGNASIISATFSCSCGCSAGGNTCWSTCSVQWGC